MRNADIVRVTWIHCKIAIFSSIVRKLYSVQCECESIKCEMKKRKKNVHQKMSIEWQLWHWICTECIECHCTICAMCIIIHFTPKQRRYSMEIIAAAVAVSHIYIWSVSQVVKTVGYRRDVIIYAVCQLLQCYWILLSASIKYEWLWRRKKNNT